jgi:UDP-N-acetylglucosamine acyltransferase
MEIHQSAVISPDAELAPGVKIGPYSIIGDQVTIGRDTVIGPHVVIEGQTKIGERNKIYQFVSIGSPPHDIGYEGESTRVVIGDDNIIREFATINRATTKQDWVTVVGNGNYMMAYAHVAHDCIVGDGVIMANLATLGGHVTLGDYANISGFSAVHQFVRIGAYAFIGGHSAVTMDLPPFMLASGDRAKIYGLNQKGLKRQGFSREAIDGLKKAYRIIWRTKGSFSEAVDRVSREIEPFLELDMLLDFLKDSKRGILR